MKITDRNRILPPLSRNRIFPPLSIIKAVNKKLRFHQSLISTRETSSVASNSVWVLFAPDLFSRATTLNFDQRHSSSVTFISVLISFDFLSLIMAGLARGSMYSSTCLTKQLYASYAYSIQTKWLYIRFQTPLKTNRPQLHTHNLVCLLDLVYPRYPM